MSINLDNVKQIMHGTKEVVKIEDSHGIVWQKVDRPTATTNDYVTVGASQNITTTQYWNRIVVPSLASIKSAIETKTGREVKQINSVKLYYLYFTRYYFTNAYYVRGFLLDGSTTSDTILKNTSAVQFTTSTNTRPLIGTTASSGLDITSYLSNNSTTNFYGAWSGHSTSSSVPTTPTSMFNDTYGYQKVYFCSSGSYTTLPTFRLYVNYDYYTD